MPRFARLPGRGVRGYVFIGFAGEGSFDFAQDRSAPHCPCSAVQVRKSFDDYGKKKIIMESVRTSSVVLFPEGSGLWLGRFVRPSCCADSGCAGSILDPVF